MLNFYVLYDDTHVLYVDGHVVHVVACLTSVFYMWTLNRHTISFYSSTEMITMLDTEHDAGQTPEAEHVRSLLRPPKPEK